MPRILGSGNLLEVFSLTGTSAFNASLLKFERIKKSDITYNDDGTVDIAIDQEEDSVAFNTLIETYGPDGDEQTSEPTEYEDGTTEGASTGSGQTAIGFIHYGGVSSEGRKMTYGIAYVAAGSGSWSGEKGKATAPKFSIKSFKTTEDCVIGNALFNTGTLAAGKKLATFAGDKTIDEGKKKVVEWLAAAS